jgi:hypothetical protein
MQNTISDCADYDSMGNHGRFPKPKNKKTMKRKLQRFYLWITLRFAKSKRKSIWKL